ncbi:uncharacterized protein LY89DRAFT_719846 [Mollisia scopiformis]|uniref:Uncharacterized protein n=1 Tax=Mollisia scopiformis TaxID=149040 RepID=A0A194X500_MOLSC|nr:uncharacterized protein LY89DRAFT_719846 [Mollisia scopiformis]KUJ15258.1 hypothetical protein LY89DRAFT_719846 [Mollisia scopiformis]
MQNRRQSIYTIRLMIAFYRGFFFPNSHTINIHNKIKQHTHLQHNTTPAIQQMCILYNTQYICNHSRPIELFPCGEQTGTFACMNGIEIKMLKAPRKKGKCVECRKKDAKDWREGKVDLGVWGWDVVREKTAVKKEEEEEMVVVKKKEEEELVGEVKAMEEGVKRKRKLRIKRPVVPGCLDVSARL